MSIYPLLETRIDVQTKLVHMIRHLIFVKEISISSIVNIENLMSKKFSLEWADLTLWTPEYLPEEKKGNSCHKQIPNSMSKVDRSGRLRHRRAPRPWEDSRDRHLNARNREIATVFHISWNCDTPIAPAAQC